MDPYQNAVPLVPSELVEAAVCCQPYPLHPSVISAVTVAAGSQGHWTMQLSEEGLRVGNNSLY